MSTVVLYLRSSFDKISKAGVMGSTYTLSMTPIYVIGGGKVCRIVCSKLKRSQSHTLREYREWPAHLRKASKLLSYLEQLEINRKRSKNGVATAQIDTASGVAKKR